MAMAVYERRPHGTFTRDPQELVAPSLGTVDAVRDHLLGLFIPTVVNGNPDWPHDPARVHRWLAVLAGFLHHNATTERTVGGRRLSSTDIVPHELWPLAGFRRPRLIALGCLVPLWLIVAWSTRYADEGITPSWLALAASLVTLVHIGLVRTWTTPWPRPRQLNLSRLGSSRAAVDSCPDAWRVSRSAS
ncbi:hypothetical protein C8E87_7814 [Paractinoplanes brasiliensis]|uniref:Uncharacterized protein n=1 Tax=Paractinoplanes brasiliensis TaxID=52695 RepID=A0A4R6JAR7_9ACTN|nr:hypothetical protein C8E87_7814 [Actinoplanes brasiliensis]